MNAKSVPSWFLLPAVLVGFLLAWVLKPSPVAGPVAEAVSAADVPKVERDRTRPSSEESGQRDPESAEPRIQARRIVIGGDHAEMELSAEEREMQDRMATAMDDRHRKQDERRIAELVQALGLDARQEAKLREFFDKRRQSLAGLWSGGDSSEAMEAMKPDKLDAFMAELLGPEQAGDWEDLKTTERNRQVEAQALKDLAGLTRTVDLRPDQRDAVYDVLYGAAGETIDRRAASGTGAMMAAMGDGMGIEMTEDLMDFDFMEEAATMKPGEFDKKAMFQRMQESRQSRIDQQVGRFEGILDADQLSRYRESLEAKSSFLDAMIPTGE